MGGMQAELHYLAIKKTCLRAGAQWFGADGMKAYLFKGGKRYLDLVHCATVSKQTTLAVVRT